METLDKDILSKEFSLSKNEALVFLELLRFGSSPIGKIIKITGLHRGTVYNTIQRLIEKGYVSKQKKENINFYSGSHFGLVKEIHMEEKSLNEKRKIVKDISKWSKEERDLDDEEVVNFFRGINSVGGYYFNLLEKCRSNEEDYLLIGAPNDNFIKKVSVNNFKYAQNIKLKMGVACKIIRNEDMLKKDWVKFSVGKTKFLPREFKFDVESYLYSDHYAIIDWDKEPVQMILIENKNFAKTQKSIFNFLWRQKAVKYFEAFSHT